MTAPIMFFRSVQQTQESFLDGTTKQLAKTQAATPGFKLPTRSADFKILTDHFDSLVLTHIAV